MKQFNLEEYKKRVAEGKAPDVVTRDGRKVRIICTDRKDDKYPIVALVHSGDEYEAFFSYSEEGKIHFEIESPLNLLFVPRKKVIKGWVNVYPDYFGDIHYTEAEAASRRNSDYIKTIEISAEIEEE